MAQALPLLKLGGLLIRTVTKPFANQIANQAKNHPFLSKRCASLGQVIHRFMTRVSVVSQGYKFVGTKPLPEKEAVAKGASFLSESIIFSIAGAVTTFEYLRSEREKTAKEAVKSTKTKREKEELMARIEKIESQVDTLVRREEQARLSPKKVGWFS